MSDSTAALPSFGNSLAMSFLFLGFVCLFGWGLIRILGRRGIGGANGMRVVSRLVIEPRRSVLVIEAGGRGFLLGSSEGGISLIAEIDLAGFAIGSVPTADRSVAAISLSEAAPEEGKGES